ncbi:MAG TPA: hypothetical protein VL595_14430 [Pseudonocardia sp.]|jgi:hypothetical protein|nr:hypothetical protein [Pseudonocardia sp.]
MRDDYCVFVILASLIALALPPAAALFYGLFAGLLVWLGARAGGVGSTPPSRRG